MLVGRSGDTLTTIVDEVKEVAELVAGIAAASDEQARGIEQVSRAVGQMESITQQTAVQTQELDSTAQTLAAQAGDLRRQSSRFRLAGTGEGGTAGTAPVARVIPLPAAAPERLAATGTDGDADGFGLF